MSDDLGPLVNTARQAADAIAACGDYRTKYVHLGIAAVHAVLGLAISVDRLASAITPKE